MQDGNGVGFVLCNGLHMWGGCQWGVGARSHVCARLAALQLYTQEFYETVVKAKLKPGGIFVTQSGPAGVMSASQVLPLHLLPCSGVGGAT